MITWVLMSLLAWLIAFVIAMSIYTFYVGATTDPGSGDSRRR